MRVAAYLIVVLASFGSALSSAAACSCPRPAENLAEDAYMAWKFEQATDVVRGRILDIRAGDDTRRSGKRIVVARMNVETVMKGDVSKGETTILTAFGVGDCGIPHYLLYSVGWDRDIILEVSKVAEYPGEYFVSMCGYGKIPPDPNLAPPKR